MRPAGSSRAEFAHKLSPEILLPGLTSCERQGRSGTARGRVLGLAACVQFAQARGGSREQRGLRSVPRCCEQPADCTEILEGKAVSALLRDLLVHLGRLPSELLGREASAASAMPHGDRRGAATDGMLEQLTGPL